MLAQRTSGPRHHAHPKQFDVDTFKSWRRLKESRRKLKPVAGSRLLRSLLFGTTRLQLLPTYVPALLLVIGAATGGFGNSAGVQAAMGVVTLGLVSLSLLL